MRQNDMIRRSVVLFANEPSNGGVGKVSVSTHQSLFQAPGIRPDTQHLEVVIRFEDQDLRSAEPVCHTLGKAPNIGKLADLHAAAREAERNRLSSVVGHAEWRDLSIIDGERHTGRHGYDTRSIQFVVAGAEGTNSSPGHEDPNGKILNERLQPSGMVIVLVRDEDGVDAVRIFANRLQPFSDFLPTHAGIDQEADDVRFYESRVAAAPASAHRDSKDHS